MNDFIAFVIHHWELWLAAAMVLVLIIFYEIKEHVRGIVHLTTHETVQMMNRDKATIVDIRDEKVFQEGHIIHALSIPFSSLSSQWQKLEKQKEKPVILVCDTGTHSLHAVKLLKRQGFKQVYALKGGFGAWRVAGLPFVR